MDIEELRKLWMSSLDSDDRAAQLIDAAITVANRPAWAADILEVTFSRLRYVPFPVRQVVTIGRSRRRWWWNPWWLWAHGAFSIVRELTLTEERTGSHGQIYLGVLFVAECAAQVIYNASGVTDYDMPFDDDCGVWLILNLRHLVKTCDSPEFAQQAWAVLESWLRRVTSPGGENK